MGMFSKIVDSANPTKIFRGKPTDVYTNLNKGGFAGPANQALAWSGQDKILDPLNIFPKNERSDTFAADTMAALTRAQWEDYKTRFRPVENALMNESSYVNPQLKGAAVAEARGEVNSAYDRGAAIDNRHLRRLGMRRTAEEQAVNDRLTGLSRSADLIDAANRTAQEVEDRNRQIALGGIPNAGRAYGMRSEN